MCTGSLLLAQAGLLDGKRATTHWGASNLLQQISDSRKAGISVRRGVRFIDYGVITSAGVSAGIDMAVTPRSPNKWRISCRRNSALHGIGRCGMQLNVALVRQAFPSPGGIARLPRALTLARSQGAVDPQGTPPRPRHRVMSDAARNVGIGVIGGVIMRDLNSGRCHNTSLVFDSSGGLVGSYRKLHLPEEEGFWETSHYDPGDKPPSVIDAFPMRLGVQVCSDINRPEGTLLSLFREQMSGVWHSATYAFGHLVNGSCL